MHDIRMSLFDLIEEHHRVGAPPHRFGKLTALFVANITRRRTNQARPGEFLHVLRHVDLNQSPSERARNVFPTPVGPRKMNEPIGRRGSFRSARERLNALLMAITASSWPIT